MQHKNSTGLLDRGRVDVGQTPPRFESYVLREDTDPGRRAHVPAGVIPRPDVLRETPQELPIVGPAVGRATVTARGRAFVPTTGQHNPYEKWSTMALPTVGGHEGPPPTTPADAAAAEHAHGYVGVHQRPVVAQTEHLAPQIER